MLCNISIDNKEKKVMPTFSPNFKRIIVIDFICFTAFHGRGVLYAGDFIYLAGERKKQCPGG